MGAAELMRSARAFKSILRDTFCDGSGIILKGVSSRVWMSNVPLDVNDGTSGGREFACDYLVLA